MADKHEHLNDSYTSPEDNEKPQPEQKATTINDFQIIKRLGKFKAGID